MSTKTSFKRIALVAVAALGFGVLTSTAPASAGSTVAAVSATTTVLTTSPTVGETVTVLVNVKGFGIANPGGNNTSDYPYQVYSIGWGAVPAKSTITTQPVIRAATAAEKTALGVTSTGAAAGFLKDSVGVTLNSSSSAGSGTTANAQTLVYDNAASGAFSQYAMITFIPDVAGTWAVTLVDPDRATYYVYTTSVTVAAKAEPTAASSTITVGNLGSGFAYGSGTDASPLKISKSTANGRAATLTVALSNGTTNSLVDANAPKLTAEVTGPGLISWDNSTYGRSITTSAGAVSNVLSVKADGTSGESVVTFSYTNAAGNKVVVGTQKISFFGAVDSIAVTVYRSRIASGATTDYAALSSTRKAVYAVAKDANGVIIPGQTLYLFSNNLASISTFGVSATTSSSSHGRAPWELTGVLANTEATLTVATGADKTATGYVSATSTAVKVVKGTPSTFTASWDKKEYLPGEAATLSFVILNEDGVAVPDGNYAGVLYPGYTCSNLAFAAGGNQICGGVQALVPSSTDVDNTVALATIGSTDTTATALAVSGSAGSADLSFNMPSTPGSVEVTGLYGTAMKATLVATAWAAPAVTVAADNSVAQAAADAAAEATDAANAATDAANAAAEAADAATAAAQDAADAVAALSTSVSEMINALKKQITSLTNLVIKIQKKVKA
jgi:hypothetical protein